jgi:hypothetical protein
MAGSQDQTGVQEMAASQTHPTNILVSPNSNKDKPVQPSRSTQRKRALQHADENKQMARQNESILSKSKELNQKLREEERKRPYVQVSLNDFVRSGQNPGEEEIGQRVAKALGFSDPEMLAYAASHGFAQTPGRAFFQFDHYKPANAVEQNESGELYKQIAALNSQGLIRINEIEPGALEEKRRWLDSFRREQSSPAKIEMLEPNTLDMATGYIYNPTASAIRAATGTLSEAAHFGSLTLSAASERSLDQQIDILGVPTTIKQAVEATSELLSLAEGGIEKITPQPLDNIIPQNGDTLILNTIGEGLGQAIPYAGAAKVSKLVGFAPTIGPLLLGAAANGGEQYDESLNLQAKRVVEDELSLGKITTAEEEKRTNEVLTGKNISPEKQKEMENKALATSVGGAVLGAIYGAALGKVAFGEQASSAPLRISGSAATGALMSPFMQIGSATILTATASETGRQALDTLIDRMPSSILRSATTFASSSSFGEALPYAAGKIMSGSLVFKLNVLDNIPGSPIPKGVSASRYFNYKNWQGIDSVQVLQSFNKPTAKVLLGDTASIDHITGNITLEKAAVRNASNDQGKAASSQAFHEGMHVQVLKASEPAFQKAAQLIPTDPQAAATQYIAIRAAQESIVRKAQSQFEDSIGNTGTATEKAPEGANASSIASLPEIYVDLWSEEVAKFIASNGSYRPERDYFATSQSLGYSEPAPPADNDSKVTSMDMWIDSPGTRGNSDLVPSSKPTYIPASTDNYEAQFATTGGRVYLKPEEFDKSVKQLATDRNISTSKAAAALKRGYFLRGEKMEVLEIPDLAWNEANGELIMREVENSYRIVLARYRAYITMLEQPNMRRGLDADDIKQSAAMYILQKSGTPMFTQSPDGVMARDIPVFLREVAIRVIKREISRRFAKLPNEVFLDETGTEGDDFGYGDRVMAQASDQALLTKYAPGKIELDTREGNESPNLEKRAGIYEFDLDSLAQWQGIKPIDSTQKATAIAVEHNVSIRQARRARKQGYLKNDPSGIWQPDNDWNTANVGSVSEAVVDAFGKIRKSYEALAQNPEANLRLINEVTASILARTGTQGYRTYRDNPAFLQDVAEQRFIRRFDAIAKSQASGGNSPFLKELVDNVGTIDLDRANLRSLISPTIALTANERQLAVEDLQKTYDIGLNAAQRAKETGKIWNLQMSKHPDLFQPDDVWNKEHELHVIQLASSVYLRSKAFQEEQSPSLQKIAEVVRSVSAMIFSRSGTAAYQEGGARDSDGFLEFKASSFIRRQLAEQEKMNARVAQARQQGEQEPDSKLEASLAERIKRFVYDPQSGSEVLVPLPIEVLHWNTKEIARAYGIDRLGAREALRNQALNLTSNAQSTADSDWNSKMTDFVKTLVVSAYTKCESQHPDIPFDSPLAQKTMTAAMDYILGRSGTEEYLRYDARNSSLFIEQQAMQYIGEKLERIDQVKQINDSLTRPADSVIEQRASHFKFNLDGHWVLPTRMTVPLPAEAKGLSLTELASNYGLSFDDAVRAKTFGLLSVKALDDWMADRNWVKPNLEFVKRQVLTAVQTLEENYPDASFDSESGQAILRAAMWNIIGRSASLKYKLAGARENAQFLQDETVRYVESTLRFEHGDAILGRQSTVQQNTKGNVDQALDKIDLQYGISDFDSTRPDAQRFYLQQSALLSARAVERIYLVSGKEAKMALEQGYVDKRFSNPRKDKPDREWNRDNIGWLKDCVVETYKNAAKDSKYNDFAFDPEVSQTVMKDTLSYMLRRSGSADLAGGLRDKRSFMRKQAIAYVGRRMSLIKRVRESNQTEEGSN